LAPIIPADEELAAGAATWRQLRALDLSTIFFSLMFRLDGVTKYGSSNQNIPFALFIMQGAAFQENSNLQSLYTYNKHLL